ncbi:MAG: ABC transporter ATP-binding protein [Planctomycetota bacterium]|jgi:putative ABC transport system ATP-binding protein|nr:ABC transporter ATP-binding protein [Planctomycetota bacterium]MDP6763974.1 ABC transporter ATP-binding protein [Planctomycetota bacterium]MDP6988500.1 ABC transporter ATP-binding protein [Planctomycetota bacterium]
MTEPLIVLEGVSRIYRRGGEQLHALDKVDLKIEAGSFYAFMGPSGSGKSTLLNLIGGLDRPDEGSLSVAGQPLAALSGADIARWRASSVGFVFQGFNLIPVLSARDNVELPLLLAPLSRAQRREHAAHALELVGLSDRADHRPSQLSGGQQQRVAIARSIVTDPTMILADEPTGDLDRAAADSVLDLLGRLHEQLDKTILMVTHDPRAAAAAEYTVHLDKGRLESVERNETPAKA